MHKSARTIVVSLGESVIRLITQNHYCGVKLFLKSKITLDLIPKKCAKQSPREHDYKTQVDTCVGPFH